MQVCDPTLVHKTNLTLNFVQLIFSPPYSSHPSESIMNFALLAMSTRGCCFFGQTLLNIRLSSFAITQTAFRGPRGKSQVIYSSKKAQTTIRFSDFSKTQEKLEQLAWLFFSSCHPFPSGQSAAKDNNL